MLRYLILVEVEWRLPVMRFRVCFSVAPLVIAGWITWDWAWPLGGKWRPSVGEWFVGSRYLQWYRPRLCRLRTDGLAPMSKYWMYRSHVSDMGLVSLVACGHQMFDFLHCFIGWLGRETGYGPVDRSAGVLWIVSGAPFLGSSDLVQHCWWFAKGCYMWTTWDTYGQGPYADRVWNACGVLSGFSPAGCTSIRITATLGYE
jgi:hypothetical protein